MTGLDLFGATKRRRTRMFLHQPFEPSTEGGIFCTIHAPAAATAIGESSAFPSKWPSVGVYHLSRHECVDHSLIRHIEGKRLSHSTHVLEERLRRSPNLGSALLEEAMASFESSGVLQQCSWSHARPFFSDFQVSSSWHVHVDYQHPLDCGCNQSIVRHLDWRQAYAVGKLRANVEKISLDLLGESTFLRRNKGEHGAI